MNYSASYATKTSASISKQIINVTKHKTSKKESVEILSSLVYYL